MSERDPRCGCITAEDLGAPPEIAPPDMIAHIHPDCPVHHDPDDTAHEVSVDHCRIDMHAGNGMTEPREWWVECSCGAQIVSWQEFYNETDADPDVEWVKHIVYVTMRKVGAA